MHDLAIDGGLGLDVDPGRVGSWLQTWTGRRYYPEDPKPEDISILDIAFALGNLARYSGHCRFYSVAEHSVLLSYIVSPEHALTALLHDATEAYLSDITRPVKRALGKGNVYFDIERRAWCAIADKFGVPREMPTEVLAQDVAICLIEKRALHPRSGAWDIPFIEPVGIRVQRLVPEEAQDSFIYRFCELTGTGTKDLFDAMTKFRLHDDAAFNRYSALG